MSAAEPAPAVVCRDLAFAWPDGTVALDGLTASFDAGRTGLIGRNGSGKSTLLRLVAGRLRPDSGTVQVAGRVGYLPQDVTVGTGATLADLLGITERRTALARIERGEGTAADFDTVDDDWDVETRALGLLDRFGLPADDLDRPVARLSGGETVLAALAGLLVSPPDVTLLDEPTNNLDSTARARLRDAVDAWPGVLVVVSHDRALLEHVDRIAELRDGTVRVFTGGFTAYADAVAAEQEAARRQVRAAEADVRRERRQLAEAQVKLARRERYAANDHANKRRPKIAMNQRRSDAQVSAGKHRLLLAGRLGDARGALDEAESRVRDDGRIRVDLPGTEVPAGRTVLEVAGLVVRGPERIALTGPNGAGKTTLLRAIVGERADPRHPVQRGPVPFGYLPQRLDVLDPRLSVLDNVRAAAPTAEPQTVRSGLARFLISGDRVDLPASTLSGGERFRVCLARLLLAEPPPQLLLFDEPTNNLDLDSVDALVDALAGYRGALILATHDARLLFDLEITRDWRLEGGRIRDSPR